MFDLGYINTYHFKYLYTIVTFSYLHYHVQFLLLVFPSYSYCNRREKNPKNRKFENSVIFIFCTFFKSV